MLKQILETIDAFKQQTAEAQAALLSYIQENLAPDYLHSVLPNAKLHQVTESFGHYLISFNLPEGVYGSFSVPLSVLKAYDSNE